ncbi:autoinducer binding domain-containing protein [Mangrovicoccus sp. HB161399]|uniref:autoinducer binding domain-containing protein n=1 Tax=Mangrovicoccus sp. HB161399 TaxID=2720392 RepID=UPI001556461F|nr:autoinducer binding domain-containing protein [Mangrovicoccus sp. HB161399]
MANWVYTSLVNSIGSLRDAGEDTLAADILRLVKSGQLETIRVFRHEAAERLSEQIAGVRDTAGLLQVLHGIAARFDASHATIHVVTDTPSMLIDPRVVTTYPDAWIARYVERGYSSIDPVIARARNTDAGFFWDSLDRSLPRVAGFFASAAELGVGAAGYTLPMRIWKDLRVALTLSSERPDAEFRAALAPQLSDLDFLADQLLHIFAEVASEEIRSDRRPPLELLRLLRALFQGSTMAEACARYGTVPAEEAESRICAYYGTRTLMQAAMVAMRLRHLDALPYERSDIAGETPAPPD